ncbi:MAG: hypothetical protein HDR32_06310 [Treponema sp.]|nr:hypothetical protein [Treponema sp.]
MLNEQNPISVPETTKIRIADEYYKRFMNQTATGETESNVANAKNREPREVFKTDWQRFLWAFILGLNNGERTKLPPSKDCRTPFGFDVFKNHKKMLDVIFALCIQERYKDNPTKLKEDFELAEKKNENLGTEIRTAMEEYANTGFAIMSYRNNEVPGYIENMEEIVMDILAE